MLDIPKLGLDLLNRVEHRIAEQSEDSEAYEDSCACLVACRGLVDPRSDVKQALSATAKNHEDLIRREKDVVRSLMETVVVRRML